MGVQLVAYDANELKRANFSMYGNQGQISLNLGEGYLLDSSVAANPSLAGSVAPARFVDDVTDPNLTSFTFNLTTGVLNLNFDEVVDVSTLIISSITLQSRS